MLLVASLAERKWRKMDLNSTYFQEKLYLNHSPIQCWPVFQFYVLLGGGNYYQPKSWQSRENTVFIVCFPPFSIILTAPLDPETPCGPETELYGRKFVLFLTVQTGNSVIHETVTLSKQKNTSKSLPRYATELYNLTRREKLCMCIPGRGNWVHKVILLVALCISKGSSDSDLHRTKAFVSN